MQSLFGESFSKRLLWSWARCLPNWAWATEPQFCPILSDQPKYETCMASISSLSVLIHTLSATRWTTCWGSLSKITLYRGERKKTRTDDWEPNPSRKRRVKEKPLLTCHYSWSTEAQSTEVYDGINPNDVITRIHCSTSAVMALLGAVLLVESRWW